MAIKAITETAGVNLIKVETESASMEVKRFFRIKCKLNNHKNATTMFDCPYTSDLTDEPENANAKKTKKNWIGLLSKNSRLRMRINAHKSVTCSKKYNQYAVL